ncbi:MAG: FAD-dependent oxidoreductase [Oscillospiraceae bacterium]|nr:FAD-dependent oxidoreductase [Oscillospiraceae bacterium]
MINSVWTDTSLPSFQPLEHDAKTDVLIVGGGLAGLLCAFMLEKAGVDYMLIEAERICRGVTGNTTAKITSQHGLIYDKLIREFGEDTARMYWQANETALNRYRQLCRDIPCDFETKNAYVYSTGNTERIERELAAAERLGIDAQYAADLPLPFRTAGAIKFENQAQFNPLKFAAGIAGGLNIHEQTTARAFHGCNVETDRGKINASRIIMATHFPIINKHGGYFLKMYQHRSYVLALENAQEVDGMYLDQWETGLSFRNYKGFLLLGGGSHRTGKQGGNWTELEAFAKKYYPKAVESCRWATQDCMSMDGIAYIGRYGRGTPDLYVATGFNKWGITSSMVAAMILCDMIQDKKNPFSRVFSPSRSIMRPQLIANVFETTANQLAISKPRCPHLGCALKWNRSERSWDCPCHGSRFTEKGKLLDNPATGDLNFK